MYSYEVKFCVIKYDVVDFDDFVIKFVNWFKLVGMFCYVLYLFSDVVLV